MTLTTAAEPAEIPTPTKQEAPQREEVTASLTTFHQPTSKHVSRVSGTDNLAASQVTITGRQELQEEEEEEEGDSISEHITESMVQMPQIEMPPPKPPTQVSLSFHVYYNCIISCKGGKLNDVSKLVL